jgi:hypothetical protein
VKKLYPYLSLIVSIIFVSFSWEHIKIPYDQTNLIKGEFSLKNYNPINEVLRFLAFVVFPIIIFLITYLICFKNETYNLNPYRDDFFLKEKYLKVSDNNRIEITSYILLLFIIIDFFIIDFNLYITDIDIFHEGTPLVPPLNYLSSGSLWLSTMYDYGLIGNNIGLIISKLIGNYSIGSIRFVNIFLMLLNEILLVLICKRLVLYLDFEKYTKNILFIILTLSVTSFINYNIPTISYFSPRAFLFLLFLLIVIEALAINKYSFLKTFLVGSFSLFSILWWIDIGIYINLIIIFLLIYLISQKSYLNFFNILLGAITSWCIFFIYLPTDEIKELFYQIKFITNISGYLLGIEYPQPFSSHSSRETKALLLLIFSGIFTIILNFNKRINLNFLTKFIISFLFISSIIFFQSSMMRSDTPHIKYASGPYLLIFYFSIIFFLFNKLQNTKVTILFKKISKNFILIFLVCFLSIINVKILNFSNIINIKNNFSSLIFAKDEEFLSEKYKIFLKYYSELTKKDDCVQVLSDDIALPYLLKKPSCTQFFIPAHILAGWTEDRFISQIKQSNHEFILYSSSMLWLSDKANMPKVDYFINENYNLYENYMGWLIYKKN